MNKTLEIFARQQLKETLAKCTPENHRIFKLMYSRKTDDSAADLEKPIDTVVDDMPVGKLDWAMQQVERTLANAAKSSQDRDEHLPMQFGDLPTEL